MYMNYGYVGMQTYCVILKLKRVFYKLISLSI